VVDQRLPRSSQSGECGVPSNEAEEVRSHAEKGAFFSFQVPLNSSTHSRLPPQDPLSSPNAKSTVLDFSPSKKNLGVVESLKKKATGLIWKQKEDETHRFQVQELDVWTPDYFKWSLRLFTYVVFLFPSLLVFFLPTFRPPSTHSRADAPFHSLYPPPIAFIYHFLSPSNFFPFLVCGSLFIGQVRSPFLPLSDTTGTHRPFSPQTFFLVHLYSQLVQDRASLQSEVMHEYNAKFVNPRIFVQKRDACVSTSEAEFVQPEDYRLFRGRMSESSVQADEGVEQEVERRGSGRRVRKRESALPETPTDSPAPRRKKGSLLVN
jgi:hypothetical protein